MRLEAIRQSLPDPSAAKLTEHFQSYLDAKELGLAFECLTNVADSQNARAEVWRALLSVAESMEINPDDWLHGPALRCVMDHLRAG